ncbi:MAG: VanZ family protein [Phycisphaerae bacterium]|nr:VanZ family protein [Phycisphaerae bacterium]
MDFLLHRARRPILTGCVAIWVFTFVATHIPAQRLPPLPVSDVLLHAAAFFILGSLFWLTLTGYRTARSYRIPLVICTMIIYASLDEATQPLVNRHAALDDWLADIAGAAAAVVAWEIAGFVLDRRRRTARHKMRPKEQ